MSGHEFCYFPFAGGRGEAIRIAIHASKIECKHTDLTFADYQKQKGDTKDNAWLNGLPVLTIDGKSYSQSLAQLRYFGKKAKLYPTDDVAALAVDEVMDVCQDILTSCPQEKDEEVKKAKRLEYAAGKLKSLFDLLGQRAEESSSGWLCGSDMTVADLCCYFVLAMIRIGRCFDPIEKTYVDTWPKLANLEKTVPEHPVYKAYTASKA